MEINVTKCDYYFMGRCSVSSNINYSLSCNDNDCYYKQLQQLKAENEELRILNKANADNYVKWRDKIEAENKELKSENEEYKQCLDEIEEYLNQYAMLGKLNIKYLLQLIKQAKEDN